MANMKYNGGDYLPASKTFADVGEPNDPRSSQIKRRPPQATRQFPVDEIVDDVYETDEMPPVHPAQRRRGDASMIGPDYARRPYYRHSTDTDPEINQERIKTAPSRRVIKQRKSIVFYIGSILVVIIGSILIWIGVVEPVIEHWHSGDSPVRVYQIRVNNKLCDVQASYLSNKVVIVVTPQDITAAPQVLEMKSSTSGNGPHVVTVQPSYDANGNPDMQTYVDDIPGPVIVNDHGLKMK